jgi:hypothetical protein
MTIVTHLQQSGCWTFKAYRTEWVQVPAASRVPHLLTYTPFIELLPRVLVPMTIYLHSQSCYA